MLYIIILKRKRNDEDTIENKRIFKMAKAALAAALLTKTDDGNNPIIPTPFTYQKTIKDSK